MDWAVAEAEVGHLAVGLGLGMAMEMEDLEMVAWVMG
jgi:hypothetical protein